MRLSISLKLPVICDLSCTDSWEIFGREWRLFDAVSLCLGNVNIYSTVWLDLKVGGCLSPDGSVLFSECEGQRRPVEAAPVCQTLSQREERGEAGGHSTGVQSCSTLHSTLSTQARTEKLSLSWDKNINTEFLLPSLPHGVTQSQWDLLMCSECMKISSVFSCFLRIARSYPGKYLRVFSCISPPHTVKETNCKSLWLKYAFE